ncbi:DinB family protein [Fictibacillus sp. Mic-4]|uniref:DinB family protein n=1 Tax=Fictibacillus TaxID=1329200 RepID=UPI00040BBF77|nr:DinB family protein [Fictibacillus gelatini]
MYRSLNDFFQSWHYEAKATKKVLNQLTDESLDQEVSPENWTLGRIAWHTVTAIKVISSQAGLTFEAPDKDWPVPHSAEFIAKSYEKVSDAFIQSLKAQWTDHDLTESINFFGQQMPKGVLLLYLNQHQTHHRGQMTVLMRQAGLTVPGIYGPSKEEWAVLGMETPKS